jgi:hypothetical protein
MTGICLLEFFNAHFGKIQALPDIKRETFSKSDHTKKKSGNGRQKIIKEKETAAVVFIFVHCSTSIFSNNLFELNHFPILFILIQPHLSNILFQIYQIYYLFMLGLTKKICSVKIECQYIFSFV